jgi:hypothetical protein
MPVVPRGEEDPEGVVEADVHELGLAGLADQVLEEEDAEVVGRPLGRQRAHQDGRPQRGQRLHQVRHDVAAVVRLAAEAVAVDRDQDLRLDLREAVDDALRAEVGRTGGPDRAGAGDSEHRHDRLGDVRNVGGDAIPALDAELAQGGGQRSDLAAELLGRDLGPFAALVEGDDRRVRTGRTGEDVLGVVELSAGEPPCARHPALDERRLVGSGGLDAIEAPDRLPEVLELVDRPAPQRPGVVEAQAALPLQPGHEGREVGLSDVVVAGRPQELGGHRDLCPCVARERAEAGAAGSGPAGAPARTPARQGFSAPASAGSRPTTAASGTPSAPRPVSARTRSSS